MILIAFLLHISFRVLHTCDIEYCNHQDSKRSDGFEPHISVGIGSVY